MIPLVRLSLICFLAGTLAGSPSAVLFPVQVESGLRRTGNGTLLAYDLFIPQRVIGQPVPPWPAVVLPHGFSRSRVNHRYNALYMAQRGIIVLTPDMLNILGENYMQLNIANTVDHVNWLVSRNDNSTDRLYRLVDPNRIGLAGHSYGGPVSIEAAMNMQNGPVQAKALCLLDARSPG